MSKKPAKKITVAAILKSPVANIAAAQKFTVNPINVSTFGLIPVAASAPTILSSSQRLHVPMRRGIIIFSCSQIFSARLRDNSGQKRNPRNHTLPLQASQARAGGVEKLKSAL